jgi:membrane protein
MKKRITLRGVGQVLKSSFSCFGEDKITKLSGSLAYSTVFSIAPLLVVIISLFGIFLGREAMEGKIYEQLNSFFGSNTAAQLQETIKNASLSGKSKTAAIIGSIILFIGATAIFSEIQDSINGIWGIKPKPKKGWLKFIRNRFLSFSVVVGLGFLLLVSLVVTAMVEAFNDKLQIWFPDISIVIFYVLNMIITLAIVALIFGVIYKVLPDADIQWKDVVYGALFTAILFMLGKFGITFYISKSNVGTSFGAAGSLVILLLWVYYSSIILYFGAEFTKAWAVKFGEPIKPNDYAVTVKKLDVETGQATVQEKEEKLSEVKTENI